MKFSAAFLTALCVSTVSAFTVVAPVSRFTTALNANAKPAASKEEDLQKTREVIEAFMDGGAEKKKEEEEKKEEPKEE